MDLCKFTLVCTKYHLLLTISKKKVNSSLKQELNQMKDIVIENDQLDLHLLKRPTDILSLL